MQQEIDSFDPYKIIEQQQASTVQPEEIQSAQPEKLKTDEPFDPYAIIEQQMIRPGAQALEGDATKAAESRKIANTLGATRTEVDLDFDNMKSLARTKQLRESLMASPSSSKWLRDNVYDAPAFQDDTPLIAEIESGIKEIGTSLVDGIKDIPKGFEAGLLVAEQGGAWADLGESAPTQEFLEEDKKRDERMKVLQGDEAGFLWNAAQVVGTMFGSVGQGVEGGGAGAALATGAMAVGAVPVAGQAVAAAGAVGTMAYGTYRIEGGLSVKQNYEATKDYDKARLIGNGVGLLNSLIEGIGIHVLGKAAKPVLDPLIAKFSPKTVAALEELTVRQALTEAAKSIALGTGQEVVTELAQEVNSIMGEELAKAWSGIDSDLTAEAFVDRLREVAVNTAKAMVVLGGISAGPVLHANLKKVNRAKENKVKLDDIVAKFKQMKAVQTSPEAAEELLDAQATDAGVSQVWVDAQALQQAMINVGVTRQDLEQVLPEAASQIDEAASVGGDVVLPTARYASTLGGTELGNVLNEHIRFERNGLSNAEALQVEQSLKQMRVDMINEQIAPTTQEQAETEAIQNDQTKTPEQKAAEITELATRRQADNDARKAYEDRIVAQMEGSNFTRYQARTQAKLAGSIVSNLARRLNIPVQEAINRYGVNVTTGEGSTISSDNGQSLSQGPQERLDLLNRSRLLDEQIRKWREGDRTEKFDLGKPSWVLQLFGVNPQENVKIFGLQFLHAILKPGESLRRQKGKHGLTDEEIRGILVGIQRPIAVFRSTNIGAKPGEESLVLLTELTQNGKNVVAPVWLTTDIDGTIVVDNQIPTAYGKSNIKQWVDDELLLGYEKEKGLNLLLESMGSNRQQLGTSNREKPLISGAIVYENDTSVGDVYQGGDKTQGAFSPAENRITLTPNANLSTFSHEIGHWYMETLIDVVRQGNASASVAEDVQALFKEFGVADVAAWDALGFEGQRKYHERFASWTEQYLAEAKAPVGLKKFFMNLGRWIRDAYREFTGGVTEATRARYRQEIGEELPELSDEVRQVLDRMVASERAVEEAQAAESLHPLFDSKPADMTDADWDEFLRARAMASEEGMSELVQRQAKDDKWYANKRAALMREKNQEAKAFREGIREKVERRLNGRKEFVARDILSSGGARFGFDNLKIDPESVTELGFSGRTVAKLTTMGVLKKGGMTVAQTRELLNPMARFSSDRQLIRGLLDTENRERIIDDQTTKICLARRSDLFNPVDLDRAITAALHNEARARVVATELKYLTGDADLNQRVLTEAARRAAIDMLDRYPARGFSARSMMTLESRASRKAYQAVASGDRLGAAIHKRQQLIYHEAARLAVGLDKKKAKFSELRKRVFSADKKLAKNYDVNVLAIARAILANRGYGEKKAGELVDSKKYLEKVKPYEPELVVGLQAYLARHPFVSSDVRAGSESAGNLVRLVEDLESLVKLARDLKTTVIDGKRELIEDAVEALVGKAWGDRFKHETHKAVGMKEIASRGWLSAKAYLRRVENWCLAMDHGSSRGPFTQYIFKPIVDAATKYRTRNKEYQKRLVDILEARRAEWDKVKDIEAPEIDYSFGRKSELIAAILHTGNESNKRKLLLGGRGKDPQDGLVHPWADVRITETQEEVIDTSRWDSFMQRCYSEGIITREDMDTVQAIWDLLEEIKPISQRAFKDYYGFYFEEIPATQIETPFGVYRGGYVPAAADVNAPGENANKQAEQDLFSEASDFLDMMPVTRPGFTQSRTNVNRPLSLNLGFLGSHIQKSLKFAMMAPAVKDVQRIITNKEFREKVSLIDPNVIDDMLVPWLKRASTQSVSNPMRGGWALNYLRSTAGVTLMAGNITNALQQLTGLSVAMSQVGAKPMLRGLFVFISHPARSIAAMKDASSFMKARLENFEYEFQNQLETIASSQRPTKVKALRDWTMRHAYFLQTWMQMIVDTPTWLAAYDHAITKGMSEKEAIFEADSVVRRTQSSFDPESVSRIETGNALERSLLVFYNYFNMQANLIGDSWAKNVKSGARHYGRFFVDLSLILAVPSILSEIIVQAFNGFDTGDDDDWDLFDAMKLLLSPVVKNSMALVPFAGQLSNMVATRMAATGDGEEGFWQIVFAPNSFNDRLVSVPAASVIENSVKAGGQLTDLIMGEEVNARSTMRNTLDAASILTGIPFAALKRPLGYAAGVASGQIDPETPVDAVRGVVSGRDTNTQ